MGGKWGDKPAEKTLGEARTQEWDADIKGVHQYRTMYDGQIGQTAFDVARPEVIAKVPDIGLRGDVISATLREMQNLRGTFFEACRS